MRYLKIFLVTFTACLVSAGLCSCSVHSEHECNKETVSAQYLKSPADCTSPAEYYCSCECGEIGSNTFTYGEPLGHSFTNYEDNSDASCESDSTKTARCDRCDATDTVVNNGTALGHSFTNYISNSDATCMDDGTETARCDRCDATDSRDDQDSALGHSFTNYISNSDATCTDDGTETAKCDRCEERDSRDDVGSKLPHTFSTEYSKNETHHWYDATCGHNLKNGEEKHTYVDKICTKCQYHKPEALIESMGDASINGVQIYMTTKQERLLDVLSYITCSDGASYAVYLDEDASDEPSLNHTLADGMNMIYIKVTSEDGLDERIYTASIYKSFSATVTFKDGNTVLNTVTVDTGYIFTPNYIPREKTGHTFENWMLSGEVYTAAVIYGDIALDARYAPNEYKILLELNGGSLSYAEIAVVYGEAYILPIPSKKGHTFIGWRLTGSDYFEDGIWQYTENIHLTAEYSVNEYTVTLDLNGGSLSYTEIKIIYGDLLSLPTPTRKGYTFVGWKTEDGESVESGTWQTDSDLTIIAEWVNSSPGIHLPSIPI